MAVGDAAASAGLAVFPNTQLVSAGSNNDNIRGDELAAEKTARVAADAVVAATVTAETAARIAADALKLNANKVIISTTTPAVVTGGVWFKPV